MLNKRHEWHCSEPGCCVFMGGAGRFDIYMGECNKRPHDPEILFLTECGADFTFTDREEMENWVERIETNVCDCGFDDDCTCDTRFDSAEEKAEFLTAVLFVRLFCPQPLGMSLTPNNQGETK